MAPLPLWTAPLNVSHKDPSFPETDFAVSVRKVGYGDERGKRQPSVARQPQLDRQWHFAVGYKQPTPFHTPAPENLVITMDEAKDKGTLELFSEFRQNPKALSKPQNNQEAPTLPTVRDRGIFLWFCGCPSLIGWLLATWCCSLALRCLSFCRVATRSYTETVTAFMYS